MYSSSRANLITDDPVAAAIEKRLGQMETEGYAELSASHYDDGIALRFGAVQTLGENYDIALLRMARVLLSDENVATVFLNGFRDSVHPVFH